MTDEGRGREQVGSVAEEAAKLFEALHVGTGDAECTYCPVCRAMAMLRQTSPEVQEHLAQAATHLLHAGAAFLESRTARTAEGAAGDASESPSRVERIDLDDDGADWDAD